MTQGVPVKLGKQEKIPKGSRTFHVKSPSWTKSPADNRIPGWTRRAQEQAQNVLYKGDVDWESFLARKYG